MRKWLIGGWLVLVALCWTGCSMTSEGLGPATTDQELAQDVEQRLDQDPVTGMQTFVVTAADGVVTLQGIVSQDAVRFRAESIARDTPGVREVVNRILLR